ncbi:Endonuclease/exonuclease/phosphatase [Lentinula detonsa]|uniref:Endonuclease/exonuclease/phosphatase n=1 Tax=Lentinula detonsa TaxID=2804962 RepID=A0AA38Q370_9AGAR|nr:Endonuclease/exonuclease/phosphatase [Lentinula detonsa]
MAASRICQRALSAFKPSNRLWVPVSSSRWAPSQVTQWLSQPSRFSLITQNLDAFSSRPIARAKLLLDGIIEECPDVIFLQEVTFDVHTAILANPKVREAFLVTDTQDQTSFEGVPFANVTLLSSKRFAFDLESQVERGDKFMLGSVSRVELPSKYGRCALSVDIIPPSIPSNPAAAYRLVNVHLDSLGHTLPYRTKQLEILANLLREPGCAGGLIAGDFNAISSDDHALLNKNGLVDAWVALHGEEGPDGATWGVEVKREDGLGAGRLDKVAMLGVEAKGMEITRPPLIEVTKPAAHSDYMPCSDHYGLRLCFTV